MPKLADLYAHLYQVAGRTPGWHGANLAGGARVDLKRSGGRVRLCLSRTGKRLGDVELTTFAAHFRIPSGAVRKPEHPSEQASDAPPGGQTRYYVIYSWRDQ